MRIRKIVFAAGVLLLIGLFTAGIANAVPVGPAPDNMNKWVGKWFSYKVTQKGIAYDYDSSKFMTGGDNESGYFQIVSWDSGTEQFQINAYHMDNGERKTDTQVLDFYAGNDLNFLFVLENEADGYAFVALVNGKEKGNDIISATVKSYGGIVVEQDDDEYRAGTMTLTAKMVAASKVPDYIRVP
jgi:hypothetical protein